MILANVYKTRIDSIVTNLPRTNLSTKLTTTTSPTSAQESCKTTASTTLAVQPAIDINALREQSKDLDLPLISALCNDRSLLKQTQAFVMPKHPRTSSNSTMIQSSLKKSYPVSGLSPSQLSKPRPKTSISHRHPNDKLPPLPMQPATANNYVMDPTPTALKHKSFSSQPNLKQM